MSEDLPDKSSENSNYGIKNKFRVIISEGKSETHNLRVTQQLKQRELLY